MCLTHSCSTKFLWIFHPGVKRLTNLHCEKTQKQNIQEMNQIWLSFTIIIIAETKQTFISGILTGQILIVYSNTLVHGYMSGRLTPTLKSNPTTNIPQQVNHLAESGLLHQSQSLYEVNLEIDVWRFMVFSLLNAAIIWCFCVVCCSVLCIAKGFWANFLGAKQWISSARNCVSELSTWQLKCFELC